jgi:hypothetical protein
MFFPLVLTGAMVLSETKSLTGKNMDFLEPLEVATCVTAVGN